MSFGESMFLAGFNQKTAKEDLFVKLNHGIPPRNQHGKTLEVSRRLSTEAGHMSLTSYPAPMGPTYHPHCCVSSPLPPRMHQRRLFKLV